MKSLFKRVVFILFWLASTGTLVAQPKNTIEHYSTEDGLSHDIVTCIFKDREGFMWFGTWNGINRFDGHRFLSFKSSPGDMSQLKNSRFEQIAEDTANHLWLKAYDGQIYCFDKGLQKFSSLADILKMKGSVIFNRIIACDGNTLLLSTINNGLVMVPDTKKEPAAYYTYRKNNPAGFLLPSDQINFLHKDRSGLIWLGTPEGLVYLEKDAKGVLRSNICNFGDDAALNYTAAAEAGDKLYFATGQGKLVVFDKNSHRFSVQKLSTSSLNALLFEKKSPSLYVTTNDGELITLNTANFTSTSSVYRKNIPLHAIFEDSEQNLWIEPDKTGVVRYNRRTNTFKTYSQPNDSKYNYVGSHFKVFEDNKGLVWAGLKDGGFGYYDKAADSLAYFYNNPASPGRLLSNIVTWSYYDPDGILWLCTDQRGIEKVIFQQNNFDHRLLRDPWMFKSDNEVRGLFCDKKNRLWVGAKSGNLYVYNRGQQAPVSFIGLPKNGLGLVYTMMEDHTGAIWLGTKANGLYRAVPVNDNGTQYILTHYGSVANDHHTISSNEIYALHEDDHGRIWVGTFDEGLNLAVPTTKGFYFARIEDIAPGLLGEMSRKIRCLGSDRAGNLWIGSTNGLAVLDPNQPGYRVRAYQKKPGDATSLGANDVQFIFRDFKDRMWLATSGGGLNLALGDPYSAHFKFKVFTTKNGLPNDYLLSCTEDRAHHLWVATQNGLSRFDPQTERFQNYNSSDGVPKTAFSEASCQQMKDGSLVFGTISGYLLFKPELINDHPIFGKMVFTNLQVNNADVNAVSQNADLNSNVNNANQIILNYRQNIFSIDYTVLDYRAGDRQVYWYRLKGFDNNWQNNQNQRRLTFTNLPSGTYQLEVKCTNTDLYQNTPIKTLKITVLPPPWRTWWAYLFYGIVIIIIFELVRRDALTKLRLRQRIKVEHQLTELKVQFFTNISHELRTPLTLILNPLDEISKKEKLSNEGDQYLQIVRRNARRMARFVNQLLDLRKVQSGKALLNLSIIDLWAFAKDIGENFKELGREKNISLQIICTPPVIYAWLDADKIETVLYNLISNAYKFSSEGKVISVSISAEENAKQLKIDVADQGKGVSKAELQDIFELYYEGVPGNGEYLKGTGIGLALSKELIELHKGTITAGNNSEGGLTVSITLPLTAPEQGHLISDPEEEYAASSSGPENEVSRVINEVPGVHLPGTPLVLLVEDNTDMRIFLKIQLQAFYRVEVAENGEEGLEKAQHISPDIIISDIMMPRMNGIEMLDQLKCDPATSHIPVVLLSAKSALESQIQGMKYGADYYVTKPFNNEFLLAAIANILGRRRKMAESMMNGKKIVELKPGEITITSQDEIFLKKVLEIVESEMGDTKFNIDAVASKMNMGRSAFFSKFKGLTQMAPVEFVREMRLQRAKQYFDAGSENIAEVAYTVGFNDSKYFSTCFKAKYQFSPSDYLRAKHR